MPLYIPLLIYLIFFLIFCIFSFFIIYHLLKFGFLGDSTKVMSTLYILAAIAIILPTVIFIFSVDWMNTKIALNEILTNTTQFSNYLPQ